MPPLSLMMRPLLTAASPAGRRAKLSILIFHRVLPAPDPLLDDVTASEFDCICGWIKEWCNVLPLCEGVQRLARGDLPARAACITFDDGYADNLTVAGPILERHGLHATFFIATGFLDGGRMWNDTIIEAVRACRCPSLDLEKLGLGQLPVATLDDKRRAIGVLIPALKHLPMRARLDAVSFIEETCDAALPRDLMLTTEQLRKLRAIGTEIGAHTVNHPILTRCDADEARREIERSRSDLEALLGERVRLFAYPNGKLGADYGPEHVRLVAELGFDAAVSTNPGASRHGDDPFQLRRFTPWDRKPWTFGLRLTHNALARPPV